VSKWIKWIWGTTVLVNLAVFIWFLVGATSNFQKSLDLVGMPIMLICGIPSIIINMISIGIIIRKWNSSLSISTVVRMILPIFSVSVDSTKREESCRLERSSRFRIIY
jgi:hypothetical protein